MYLFLFKYTNTQDKVHVLNMKYHNAMFCCLIERTQSVTVCRCVSGLYVRVYVREWVSPHFMCLGLFLPEIGR